MVVQHDYMVVHNDCIVVQYDYMVAQYDCKVVQHDYMITWWPNLIIWWSGGGLGMVLGAGPDPDSPRPDGLRALTAYCHIQISDCPRQRLLLAS